MKFTEQIKQKTPVEFELAIKDFFEQILGFKNIQTTDGKGDFGADLLGEFNGKKHVIQVKKYSAPVNLKAVQEVYSAMAHYEAESCWVVTNSTYTESAINLAKSTNCLLVDGNDLDKLFVEKLKSFDEKIDYLQKNKIRSFRITNDQLISAYSELKKQLKRQPTVEEIDKLGEYSSSSYKKRWGRWNLFLREIGETCLVNRDITKDDLLMNFIDVSTKLKKTPTTSDMNKEGRYSVSTYERHFGTWNAFLEVQSVKPTKRHLIPKDDFISEYKKIKAKLKKVPTKAEFDKLSNISSNSFRRIWGSWSKFLKKHGEKTRDVSDQELIEEYHKLKAYLGRGTLTQEDMNAKGRFSSSTYERRFGSWNKFLQSINESPNIKTGITKDDLLKDYLRIADSLNKIELSTSDVKKHSVFSLSTFLKKFGFWNKCKEEALKQRNT
ncbi:MAG: hypothetical protein A3J85_03230 [Desulfobacula sp. RIFOXYA12_FULL_46_16]|nr:MAG: hypothetical protein A2464_04770 [Deltaproteobacteria bacterium RIFOXYC2_FULL_48_10]OGR21902.1 MAG: hypothetical protein A3J85_03230 [Desulfobacula sp. RIFOXYA12_FULL_46_16]